MNLVTGRDLFEAEVGQADVILVTTNAMLNQSGHLVMGAGAARQAATLFPRLPAALGEELRKSRPIGGRYGCLIILEPMLPTPESGLPQPSRRLRLGAFQVKRHWRDAADLALIAYSAGQLADFARQASRRRFALNYPGVGLGRLPEAAVRPLLELLPENVWVYRNDG